MSEYRYAPGPIRWEPIDVPAPDDAPGDFEDLFARALIDAPDLELAIDTTRVAATPTDPQETDAGDDPELIASLDAIAGTVARVADAQITSETAAIDGIDPEIAAGAQDVADAGADPGLDYMPTTLPAEGGTEAPVPNPWPFPRSPPPGS